MAEGCAPGVCVYCGSRAGDDPAFVAEARQLGRELARAGLRVVYGAGDIGMMGAVADGAKEAGGQRLGVITQHLIGREARNRDLNGCIVTETMHERKKVMFMNADAVVALPGGPGTLDELFEVLTWRQLGLHDKPVLLLNTLGYWDPLIALIDSIITRGFADRSFAGFLTVCQSPDAVIAELRARLSRRNNSTQ